MIRKPIAATWLLGVISMVGGVACVSAPRPAASDDRLLDPDACLDVRRVDSFSPLHERFVYVRDGDDKHYLLTLDAVYIGLPHATGIAISGTFSRICSDTGAMITFMESGHPVSCRIVRVEAVADRAAAQEVVEDRTTPKSKR